MIVTTNVKENAQLVEKAKVIAHQLNVPYVKRNRVTITMLLKQYTAAMIIYTDKIEYVNRNEKLFFHPNTAMLRIRGNRLQHNNEPLIAIIGTQPKNILDLTMGLASDSIVMSYYGHQVTALESNPIIHCIVSAGLKSYMSSDEQFNQAMRNIQTYCIEAIDYLKQQDDNSVDIIYIDPMFSHVINESKNLKGLSTLSNKQTVTDVLLAECQRVSKEKIIIKAHYKDDVFEKYGLQRIVRPNIKFHFGVMFL